LASLGSQYRFCGSDSPVSEELSTWAKQNAACLKRGGAYEKSLCVRVLHFLSSLVWAGDLQDCAAYSRDSGESGDSGADSTVWHVAVTVVTVVLWCRHNGAGCDSGIGNCCDGGDSGGGDSENPGDSGCSAVVVT
jgi:hypothetical protein